MLALRGVATAVAWGGARRQALGGCTHAPLAGCRARAIWVTAAPRAPEPAEGGVLPELPGASPRQGGGESEVGRLYDSYAASGAARGIVDFETKLGVVKGGAAPLPEVRMSDFAKHAIPVSRCALLRPLPPTPTPPPVPERQPATQA